MSAVKLEESLLAPRAWRIFHAPAHKLFQCFIMLLQSHRQHPHLHLRQICELR